MKKILHIISSPRGEASFSTKLGTAIIEKLQMSNRQNTVHVHDLTKVPIAHLAQTHLDAYFTRPESRTPDHRANLLQSDEAIKELTDADIIVISVPIYNFNIHSTLKAWIDSIVRGGQTVMFGPNGPEGGRFGDMLHPIPWQTDHPFCWQRNASDALAA